MMTLTKRRVCVVLVDRANYGRLRPVMQALRSRDDIELQVVAGGTMVLERFGRVVDLVRSDGFDIAGHVFHELEGSTPATMAKSVGIGVMEFANEFIRLAPDVVVVIGDRYEALAATIAAAYLNFCIVHLQGGEVSGSIDESARHAISKFAHFHVPSTKQSAAFLVRMGEVEETILAVGCPSSDIARISDRKVDSAALNSSGSGAVIDVDRPYLLVVFHPTTTEFGNEKVQVHELLAGLADLAMPTLLLWPNIDAGADHIAKAIRQFRDRGLGRGWMRTVTNIPPEAYLSILASAACAIGNSSSFVRDASFFGTPVVLIGNRQDGRERAAHVLPSGPSRAQIAEAIQAQLSHGTYAPSDLYGDGWVAPRIAEGIASLKPYVQKRLAYQPIR